MRMTNKAIAILAMAFACASGVHAQVSCSPNVGKKMCADVAESLNPIVDHGSPYKGVGIRVELVTPAEYEKRLSDTRELEQREESFAGGDDAAAKSPDKFSRWYRHTLWNGWSSSEITFFRDRPSSRLVSAILISSKTFERPAIEAKYVTEVGYYVSSLEHTAHFIIGYLYGTMSTADDGSRGFDAEPEPKKSSNSPAPTELSLVERQSTTTFRGHTLGESWRAFRHTDSGLCELNKANSEGCSKAAAGEEAMLSQQSEKDHADVTFHFEHSRFDWALASISGPTFTSLSFLEKTYGPPSFKDIHPEKGSALASWRFPDGGEVSAVEIADPSGGFLITISIQRVSGEN